MRLFLILILISAKAFAVPKISDQISSWLDDTYSITDASTQIYRASLSKQDSKRKKLDDEKVKKEIKTNVQLKISKKLESEFSESELKYLNDLFHHPLLVKFEKLRLNLYQSEAVKEVVEKK